MLFGWFPVKAVADAWGKQHRCPLHDSLGFVTRGTMPPASRGGLHPSLSVIRSTQDAYEIPTSRLTRHERGCETVGIRLPLSSDAVGGQSEDRKCPAESFSI